MLSNNPWASTNGKDVQAVACKFKFYLQDPALLGRKNSLFLPRRTNKSICGIFFKNHLAFDMLYDIHIVMCTFIHTCTHTFKCIQNSPIILLYEWLSYVRHLLTSNGTFQCPRHYRKFLNGFQHKYILSAYEASEAYSRIKDG